MLINGVTEESIYSTGLEKPEAVLGMKGKVWHSGGLGFLNVKQKLSILNS